MEKKPISGAIKAVKMAMIAEAKASQLYAKAAAKASNPQGKEIFQQLSDFEKGHLRRLKELLTNLTRKGRYVHYSGQSLTFKVKGESEGHIEENAETVIDVLIQAIAAERDAEKGYSQLAAKTKDPDGKQMFEQLAHEEKMHFRLLSDQFYNITNKGMWGD